MKICKDCKHYKPLIGSGKQILLPLCESPQRGYSMSKVTGEKTYDYSGCDFQRSEGYFWARILKRCGKEGRFYE